jgi:cobalt/nickel transport system permease protein
MPSTILTILLLTLAAATPAHAMHISEGILPLGWASLWFAIALPFVALGCRELKKLSQDDLAMKPLVGLLAAGYLYLEFNPLKGYFYNIK